MIVNRARSMSDSRRATNRPLTTTTSSNRPNPSHSLRAVLMGALSIPWSDGPAGGGPRRLASIPGGGHAHGRISNLGPGPAAPGRYPTCRTTRMPMVPDAQARLARYAQALSSLNSSQAHEIRSQLGTVTLHLDLAREFLARAPGADGTASARVRAEVARG